MYPAGLPNQVSARDGVDDEADAVVREATVALLAEHGGADEANPVAGVHGGAPGNETVLDPWKEHPSPIARHRSEDIVQRGERKRRI